MSKIKVSIVIPTYNRKHLLEKTLKSLYHQTYPKDKYEIIVCDDGSSDGTEEMLKELMKKSPCVLRYYKQKNEGASSARNLGIENAKGEIIGFTDDDCVASSTWIEHAMAYFENNKVDGVGGCILPQSSQSDIKGVSRILFIRVTREFTEEDGCGYPTGNIFYRRKELIEIGGFDTEFIAIEDTEMGLRLKKKGCKIHFSSDMVVYHAVTYVPLLNYLKSLKKYEFKVLLRKKYPELKKRLILGFINEKKHIYPIFIILFFVSCLLYMIFNISVSYVLIFFGLSVLSYLWGHVFIDSNVKKYPLRIILFVRYFIPDTIRLYYAILGSIRYGCLYI